MSKKLKAKNSGCKKVKMHTPRLPEAKAAFSRGMSVNCGDAEILFISGTASVDNQGQTAHKENFPAQVRHTYENIESLLSEAGASVRDVVKFTVYLKDMDQYEKFDELRVEFLKTNGLTREEYPASTCVQARLCRDDLLLEIDAIAIIKVKK